MLPDFEATLARAKSEVIGDILDGTVPHDVKSFSELHDYVDANYYGGAFELEFNSMDETLYFWNKVQNSIDAWIKSGGMFDEACCTAVSQNADKPIVVEAK